MKLITHDGVFHADEVLAIALLIMFGHGKMSDVIRTRSRSLLDELGNDALFIDVGGVYDPAIGRFDHHQRNFDERRPDGGKYSSAGLVWLWLKSQLITYNMPMLLWEGIDKDLVAEVDRIDNGGEGSSSGFSALVSGFNKPWFEEGEEQDENFQFALKFALMVLTNFITRYKGEDLAQQKVQEAVASSADPRLIIMEQFVPWQKTIVGLESPQFVIYPAAAGNNWMVQAVPIANEDGSPSKRNRTDLPKEWGGLSDEALEAVSGIPGSVFCHNNLFIGSNKTREGAVAMAVAALS